MFRNILKLLFLFATLSLASCKHKPAESTKMQLTVSIIPQKYLAEFIAGDKFDVQAMLPPGSNHETYEPAPRDMEKISESKLYLALGSLDFELTWLDRLKASNPAMKVINTSEGIKMIGGHIHDGKNELLDKGHGIDPHTWLSPACMKIQAFNICKALSEIDEANATYYQKNLAKFINLADSVDSVICENLKGDKNKFIIIFHPALAYFCRDYGLTQISIEQDGKEPSPAYMTELVEIAKKKGIKSILISKEFDTRNAEAIAHEIDGYVVAFDIMAENWPHNLIQLAQLIAQN